jgi:hypothetical protein
MTLAARIAPEAAPLDRAFARLRPLAPDAVRRALRGLGAALEGLRRSCWPEIAWRSSGLTNTGYPVELSWSSRDAALRWTAEVAGPETPEAARLNAAVGALAGMGVAINLPDWLAPQPGRRLRFGAWIGGRHDAARDRYKIYVDMAGADLPADLVQSLNQWAVPARTLWRMAGLDAAGGGMELYGRLHRPEIWEVERLLSRCGGDASAVIDLAAVLSRVSDSEYLLPGTAGLSLATMVDGRHVVSFFVQSGPLIGGDAAIARKIRKLAQRHGWDTALYEALLGDEAPGRPGRHGIIGFGAAAEGVPWMQVGLRP